MITFDPAERISVAEALKHPWLSTYHNPDDEPDCAESFQRWREIEELETNDDFKSALWDEIQDYRREVRGLKSVGGSPVAIKWTSPTPSHPTVDPQTQPPATTARLDRIKEETAVDLKTGTTRSSNSNSASPHQKEEPTTTETSPLPPEPKPSKGESESQPALPPPKPLPPVPSQDDQRSRPISRTKIGRSERRPSHDQPERPTSTASITTPTDPVVTYARRSSFLQQPQPSIPDSGRSSPVHPYHTTNHLASRKPIPNFGEAGYFDEGANLKEQYGHAKHLNRNTVAFPSGESYVVPARSRTSSVFGQYPSGVPFPSSTHAGDGVSGLPGVGNHGYTVGPGTVSRLLRTLSTVSIHESGQGLKGGLADIAPIGKFITERGSDDELASEVPEEFKEGGSKDAEKDKDKDVREGRRRSMFRL